MTGDAVKVVLREHVENLGERGEIVFVATGYARNYLLPKRLAVQATPGNLKVIEQQRRVWAVRDTRELTEAQEFAEKLSAVELKFTKKAGPTGTLYGSVTNAEIAEALAGKGFELDRRRIVLDNPIKSLGEYEIPIKVFRNVQGRIKLSVLSDSPASAVPDEKGATFGADERSEHSPEAEAFGE